MQAKATASFSSAFVRNGRWRGLITVLFAWLTALFPQVALCNEENFAYVWTVQLDETELASERSTALARVQEKAAEQVADWLRQVWPEVHGFPTAQLLRDRGVIIDIYAETRILQLPEGPRTMFKAVAQCRLSKGQWRELLEMVRRSQSQGRIRRFSEYGLLPIAILLAAVWLVTRGDLQKLAVAPKNTRNNP